MVSKAIKLIGSAIPPSPTDQRLLEFIAERMHMGPIQQRARAAIVVKAKAARLTQGVERMLLSVPRWMRQGTGPAQPHPEPGWLQPLRAHARRDPSRGSCLTGRPKPNLARTPCSRHHQLHGLQIFCCLPSPARIHLRADAHETHRSVLMLLELLGRRSPAPAHNVARRILGSAWWAGFTFNVITAYGNGAYSLIGGEELSDTERDELLELCRQRLDAFREQRGEEVFAHRLRNRTPISGSVKYRVPTRA